MNEREVLMIRKRMYSPVCSPEEIERIFDIRNGSDYLLKARADVLMDSTRLFRVYLRKVQLSADKWSLQESFNDSHYYAVLYSLTEGDRRKLGEITFGDIFSRDPQGNILVTDYGP